MGMKGGFQGHERGGGSPHKAAQETRESTWEGAPELRGYCLGFVI